MKFEIYDRKKEEEEEKKICRLQLWRVGDEVRVAAVTKDGEFIANLISFEENGTLFRFGLELHKDIGFKLTDNNRIKLHDLSR